MRKMSDQKFHDIRMYTGYFGKAVLFVSSIGLIVLTNVGGCRDWLEKKHDEWKTKKKIKKCKESD